MIRSSASLILAFSIANLVPALAHAQNSGFAFLEIPTGARASALGGAYETLTEGVDASFWNPAGLSQVRDIQVLAGHYELYQTLHHDHFALARKTWGGGLGASVRALYSGPIDERDEIGNLIGSFGVNDLDFGIGYGHPIGEELEIGGSAHWIHERIADAATSTYSFGVGASWKPSRIEGLKLSAVGENLGGDAHYFIDGREGGPVPLPMAAQGGAAYTFSIGGRTQVRTAFEGRFARGRDAIGMAGIELGNLTGATLRAGFRLHDDAQTLSLGAGYGFSTIRFDYAFVPLGLDLGDTHRFSLAAQF